MNKAYKNMRSFWLDVNNLENKKGLEGIGEEQVLAAGLEYCMADHNGVLKNIILAASVLGNASLYFENNSPAGIGGLIGENDDSVKKAVRAFIEEGAALCDKMMPCDFLPEPKDPLKVTLFAINKNKTFYTTIDELSARDTANPFYRFYAYSQQLIGVLRRKEEQKGKK